jgi:hypothetical protein
MPEMLEKPMGRNFWYFKDGNDYVIKATLKV